MQTEVKAVKHVDVRGKELLYITIGEGLNQAIINVGEKTYKRVQEIIGGPIHGKIDIKTK